MTKDIGGNGNLFGGTLLSWCDESGAVAAVEYAGDHRMVTLKMNEVIFKKPIKVHDVVSIYADIKKIGNTSITIQIEVKVKEEDVAATEMVFVRVDENGKPVKIIATPNNMSFC